MGKSTIYFPLPLLGHVGRGVGFLAAADAAGEVPWGMPWIPRRWVWLEWNMVENHGKMVVFHVILEDLPSGNFVTVC